MAGGANPRSGGRGRGRRRRRHDADINVTPLVDVMLVLLIVFMVTAPLLQVGVDVEMPETVANALQEQTDPITLTVTKTGNVYLQDTEIPVGELVAKLEAISENGYDEHIYLRGDKNTDYGQVMQIMAQINSAGFTKIGLVNEALTE